MKKSWGIICFMILRVPFWSYTNKSLKLIKICRTLFHTSVLNQVVSEPSVKPSSRYKPFGLYLFCSETGVACFSELEFVLELLGALSSKNMQLTDCGLILEGLKDKQLF